MSVVPSHLFAAQFARLQPVTRADFLADLWTARGRTVERDDTALLLDGTTRVTLETTPDRLDEAVDVVVAPDPSAALLDWAASAGAEVRDASDVHELLLYGVDRETADALYRSHFDRSLYYTDDELDSGRAALDRIPTAWVALASVALVAILLVAAGPVELAPHVPGLAGSGVEKGGETGTVHENQSTVSPLPPGVAADGPIDAGELASAHARRLRGTGFTMRTRYEGPANGSSYERASTVETSVHVQNNSVFRFERRAIESGVETTADLYADGDRQFYRVSDKGDVTTDATPVGGASNVPLYVGDSRWNLLRFLDTTRASIERRPDEEVVRVRATGTPRRLDENVSGYSARALVRPDGLVERLTVEYVDEDDGTPVSFVQTVENVGATSVPEPDWYADHPATEPTPDR